MCVQSNRETEISVSFGTELCDTTLSIGINALWNIRCKLALLVNNISVCAKDKKWKINAIPLISYALEENSSSLHSLFFDL